MQYHIARNGQQAGTFSEEDVRSKLLLNEFSPSDLCWTEGMAEWQPLGVRFAQTTTPRVFVDEINPYAPPLASVGHPPGGVIPAGGGDRTGPAWEQRATLGIPRAIVETWKAVLLRPTHTFITMRREGGIGVPFAFFMVTASIGIIASQIYGVIFQGAMLSLMSGLASDTAGGSQAFQSTAMLGGGVVSGVVGVIVLLILIPTMHFISSGLVHLALMMLKGANHPFETTFRVASYASGSAMVLYLVPVCGSIVGWVWGIVAMCIGLGKAHDTSTEKGVAATLIPLVVCCLLVGGLYAAVIGTLVASGGNPPGK